MVLSFTDVLRKAGIDPAKTKLIRHALTDKGFKECYDCGKVYEYTCHQKPEFSKGYDYWAVFISDKGTKAKFYGIYHVEGSVKDTKANMPKGLPEREAAHYNGDYEIYDLKEVDCLKEYVDRLTIEWGKSTRMWHQKGTTEKEIISIQADKKKVFSGFEDLIISYDELKEIVEDEITYGEWHSALASVYAIYLIVDTESGKQYVGSAYDNENGLLGRWECYVQTHHGNNKLMKELICYYPERFHKFQFSVLQILPKTLSQEEVVKIETRYKRKLMSYEPNGMNAN